MEEAKADGPGMQLDPFLLTALVLTILGTLQLGLFPSRLLGLAQAAAQGLFSQ
jgi:hypothetical protein